MQGCCRSYSKISHKSLNAKNVKAFLEFSGVIILRKNEFTDICPSIYSSTFKVCFKNTPQQKKNKQKLLL